ncbi:hypothetical protein FNV43_RR21515 [Rhamnella rubrinervis]|uniref:Uncharacterized protein n=1 Tax=Rhamnella rubrinervis TaxID=2594499 RepID=A0A8K0E1T7_9ROSA|nr:hypothetical protein FNV43_RR21515 [Rhamnella rubrinervis]
MVRGPGARSDSQMSKRLSTDISLVIDEERAKCDTWCELRNPAEPSKSLNASCARPLGRGHARLAPHNAAPTPNLALGAGGADAGLPRARSRLAQMRAL